ncbi:hypothetical protein GCM10011579_041610 [Streptomyces albiflavescens]|uniref:Uncharacterized protein n=1 Tax=Streptomyces albiflavescens TaxID=1623582 RepID=A0A917Y4K2_9ACTN|nr:hypothetical protein GCM10011579_041610 [Streptomyces albiflavescens]
MAGLAERGVQRLVPPGAASGGTAHALKAVGERARRRGADGNVTTGPKDAWRRRLRAGEEPGPPDDGAGLFVVRAAALAAATPLQAYGRNRSTCGSWSLIWSENSELMCTLS